MCSLKVWHNVFKNWTKVRTSSVYDKMLAILIHWFFVRNLISDMIILFLFAGTEKWYSKGRPIAWCIKWGRITSELHNSRRGYASIYQKGWYTSIWRLCSNFTKPKYCIWYVTLFNLCTLSIKFRIIWNWPWFFTLYFIDAFDKRDAMQSGSVRIGRTEVCSVAIAKTFIWIYWQNPSFTLLTFENWAHNYFILFLVVEVGIDVLINTLFPRRIKNSVTARTFSNRAISKLFGLENEFVYTFKQKKIQCAFISETWSYLFVEFL